MSRLASASPAIGIGFLKNGRKYAIAAYSGSSKNTERLRIHRDGTTRRSPKSDAYIDAVATISFSPMIWRAVVRPAKPETTPFWPGPQTRRDGSAPRLYASTI